MPTNPAPSTVAVVRRVVRLLQRVTRSAGNQPHRRRETAPPPQTPRQTPRALTADQQPRPVYAPRDDDDADPGEVVWAWVPYEDDPAQGKDRPVLIIARDGAALLGLYLSSRDHDRDADEEAQAGRYWLDIGSGGWDARGRPSEVRVDRIVRLEPSSVRRVGARLDRARFDEVTATLRAHHQNR